MMRTADTDVIAVAALPPSVSTRILNLSGRSTAPSGQPSTGVSKRPP